MYPERIIYDTFTAADSTSLVTRNADTGQSWTKISTSTTNPTVIMGNKLAYTNPNGKNIFTVGENVDTYYYTVEADLTFTAWDATYGPMVGIIGRWDGSVMDRFTINQDSVSFNTNVSVTNSSFTTYSQPFSNGSTCSLRVVYTPTTVTAYINGSQYGPPSTTITPRAGKAGVYVEMSAGSLTQIRLDNFQVTKRPSGILTFF